ncbi:MAG: energy transducer TonB [Acidobacteriota bacterium]|nr:energy transducer TonB [Acidobacteriota bacterium]
MKPWHLKMSVQLFDAKGKLADSGTVEEWWSSPQLDRRQYKSTAYSATEIRRDGRVYRTPGADLPPYYLALLRWQVVHPVRKHLAYASGPKQPGGLPLVVPVLKKVTLGKISMDCISYRSASAKDPAVLGRNTGYCLSSEGDSLRMSLDLGGEQIFRNAIGRFQDKEVAVDSVVYANDIKAASEHVDSLASALIPETEFEISADTPEVTPPIVAEGENPELESVLAKSILSRGDATYPEQAKFKHLAGSVVLRGIIGTSGKIRDIQVISSSDPLFVPSAMDALRDWKYKPIMLGGVPVEVETTIQTIYSMGQSSAATILKEN